MNEEGKIYTTINSRNNRGRMVLGGLYARTYIYLKIDLFDKIRTIGSPLQPAKRYE
jgi:hypothetical protein